MHRASLATVALATFASIPLLAQQGGQSAPPPSPGSPAAVQVPTTSAPAGISSADAGAADMKPVKAELVGKLDSKSAKPGDSVVVKTREAVTIADGTQIPKGSKVIGHVTAVQAHSKTSQNSEVAVQFDRAELKSGQTLPIHSMIESVAPPMGEGQTGSADPFGPAPMPSGGGSPGGGGAMAGGAHGGSSGAAASAPAPVSPSTATSEAPVAGGSSAQAAGNGSAAGKVVAGSGPNAIRTTDIPNVFLASNAAGSASGTLFAAKDNVHLDGGTQFVLDIAATGSH